MRLIDADVLPEISLFGTTEYINVKKAPTVKAIPLDKIIQAVEKMQKEIEENHLNVIEYADGEWIVKDFVYGAIERLKRNLESED